MELGKGPYRISELRDSIERLFSLACLKIKTVAESPRLTSKDNFGKTKSLTPVFTVDGKYVPQGWTEWTQGFQFGLALLCFDGADDEQLLELGRKKTLVEMPTHLTGFGVHDHGFNNVSTYGNLRRLQLEGRVEGDENTLQLYETALKVSGAVQAYRWTDTADESGFIFSFNGPHSLFCDTIRSLRSLAIAHRLGHVLMDENDEPVSLLERLMEHAETTANYNVYYGEGRDEYDVRGRVAHESIFNLNDGRYRCPSTQQGYSPFSTWTRGLAWVMLGYPEQLEFLETLADDELEEVGGRDNCRQMMLNAARAACDFYIENTPSDGIPYWDTGAPGLVELGDYLDRPADPYNDFEPVDSSAAAIGAQGLLRLARVLQEEDPAASEKYMQAGLWIAATLFDEPYLSTNPEHEGILLHSVYHRPRGWDHIAEGSNIPNGESSMWGDYHVVELALYLQRLMDDSKPYYTFWSA